MTALIIILCLILLSIIAVQYGRFRELSAKIRGEEAAMKESNNRNAAFGVVFVIGFLIFCVVSALYYRNWMLGYGPHESASEHGIELDALFDITLFFTGIVFVLTQIFLFWFAYKYREEKGRKALFMPHDNTLELVWTVIPAVVMCFLVVRGLYAWNEVMADVDPDEEYMEIEALGQQWNWLIRYPGADNLLGETNYRLFSSTNPLAQDWNDTKNLDDFHPNEIVLPKGKKVRVRIRAKDVLHNFDLPHFRVKMDAIPGLPTYFVFTPRLTTEEYRENLKQYPEYQALNEDGVPLWESFNYELACAELCGRGHFSMKRIVRIVEQEEYDRWLATQTSWYEQSVMGTADDPFGDLANLSEIPAYRAAMIANEFNTDADRALAATDEADKTVILKHVYYATGKYDFSGITEKYYLTHVASFLKKNPDVVIELSGHTDNVGSAEGNQVLSENRANKIADYLRGQGIGNERMVVVGYGQDRPIADNASPEGRAQNRRTEFKIISQSAPITNTETTVQ